MDRKTSIMSALLVLDVALLGVSGIPAIKHAGHGWKLVVGDGSWGGFLVGAVSLIVLAGATVVRRNRAAA